MLLEKIKELGGFHGIDFIGAAGLSHVKDAIKDTGGVLAGPFPRALSVGIRLQKSIVNLLEDRQTHENSVEYKTHAYDVINFRLDHFASIAASVIQSGGYNAMPLPASERIDSDKICASISHKMTARLAGFGWIGKNCLLIHPDYGPRVRWTTVLTDAPLEENSKIMQNRCGSCDRCVKICPVQAISGRAYKDSEPRDLRLDAKKCEQYYNSLKREGSPAVCGMCLYVCPYGKKE